VNLSESERTDLARELDTANDYLLRAVEDDDDKALQTALGYGIAALCRFASEVVKPPKKGHKGGNPNQLEIWPEPG
jgi:hypothetical protein